jgi:hypothetical protein
MAKTQGIDYGAILSQLNMPDLTEAAVKSVLNSKGITTQAAADKWASQNAAPGPPGDLEHAVERFKSGLQTLYDINPKGSHNVAALVEGITGSKPSKAKADPAKKKSSTSTTSPDDALQELANLLTQGYVQQGEVAMGQVGQQLAQQNQAVTNQVDQLLTGTSSGNPAVDAAQAAYAKAYSAGEGLNSAAYANMGMANAQYEAASPLQPVLSILTSGLGSGQYKQLPASLVANLPPSVQYALQQAGVAITEPGQTGSSGQAIPNPKGGWPKSITAGQKAASTVDLSSLLGGVTAPSTTNPVSNPPAYGNPNTPGQ